MGKRTGKETELKKLTASLREFSALLPTAADKQELHQSITAIMDFLSGIQRMAAAMPTSENTAEMESALRALDQFADRAKTNPGIAALLGIPQPRPSRPRAATYTNDETATAQRALSELQVLPIDQMRLRLQDENAISIRLLQAMASQLGIRSVQRTGRDSLSHQIASKISNYRGYQGLRAGTEGS